MRLPISSIPRTSLSSARRLTPRSSTRHDAGSFRAAAGIADTVVLVGAAGRIDSWKGFEVLLDAFEDARARRDDIELVVAGGRVAGKEALFDQLETRAASIAGVHWLGERSDMPELFADLDLFVLPTTVPEPYGLVVVEALTCGVPAVVTDAGGPREIALDAAPGSVRLVRSGDAAELRDGVLAALDGTHRSSTDARRQRRSLRPPEPERVGAVLREVARSQHQPASCR